MTDIKWVYICVLDNEFTRPPLLKSIPFSKFGSFEAIHKRLESNPKLLVFLGEGLHKIKKKAEQVACEEAIKLMQ